MYIDHIKYEINHVCNSMSKIYNFASRKINNYRLNDIQITKLPTKIIDVVSA